MKNKKKAMVVVQLNIDVIAEILSRLRVKDLVRFKCVCKAWHQLISSQEFIQLHLKRSSFRAIPLQKPDFDIACCRLPSVGIHARSIFSGSSCDGLVCLFNPWHSVIHIWNPSTHSSACINVMTCPGPIRCFWFGRHNDEYKLVLGTVDLEMHIVRPCINPISHWKSTQKLNDGHCRENEIGTLVNDNVHWPVTKRITTVTVSNDSRSIFSYSVSTILSYDLHQEKVGEILIPMDKTSDKFPHRFRLGVVDGCLLALFEKFFTNSFELWAMKDYGFSESWTKLIVLEKSSIPFCRINPKKEVVLVDPEMIKSPLYAKEMYVESLICPELNTKMLRSLKSHKKTCRIRQIV